MSDQEDENIFPGTYTFEKMLEYTKQYSLFDLEYSLQGFDVNFKDEYGVTFLHTSAIYNRAEAMKILLNQPDADIDCKDENGITPLMLTVKNANTLGCMKILCKNGADYTCPDFGRIKALRHAFTSQNLNMEEIETLMRNMNYTSSVKQPLVYEFMFKPEIIDLLKGFMDDSSNDHQYFVSTFGHTVLYYGCEEGSLDLVKFIVEKGIVDINIRGGRDYETPLQVALCHSFLEIADYLVQMGASLKIKDIKGYTGYDYAAIYDNAETFLEKHEPEEEFFVKEMFELLFQHYRDKTVMNYIDKCMNKYPNGPEILKWACSFVIKKRGLFRYISILAPTITDKYFVFELLKKWTNKIYYDDFALLYNRFLELETDNERIKELSRYLFVPAMKNRDYSSSIADLLLDQGIDLKDIELEESFFFSACRMKNKVVLELLLKQGVDVNQLDSDGLSALYYATLPNDLELVQILLKYGANIKFKDRDGRTSILRAAYFGYTEVFFELFKVEKDLNQRSNDELTLFLAACHSGNPEIIKALVEAGACLTDVDERNHNCLHLLAGSDELSCDSMIYLFEKLGKRDFTIMISAVDKDGLTPMKAVQNNFSVKMISELLLAIPDLSDLIVAPTFINIQISDQEHQEMCLICRDSFVQDDSVIVLLCKHMFHEDCFSEWSKSKAECPYCQKLAFIVKNKEK